MRIIECPRDAMQGLPDFIPTETKTRYINQLLKVGFDTIDFGSFVSPKAVPQMKDTTEVLEGLEQGHETSLLAIIANERGAREAAEHERIDFLGFPLSLSETFQQKNTNKSIQEAMVMLSSIQHICQEKGKTLVVYLSMGFGNPYGDPWSPAVVTEFVQKLYEMDVNIIELADTTGASDPDKIHQLFEMMIPAYPEVAFGAHLHSRPKDAKAKIEAAYKAGCARFHGALKGFGGCPMAEDELVGNIATETIVEVLEEQGEEHGVDREQFLEAVRMAGETFPA